MFKVPLLKHLPTIIFTGLLAMLTACTTTMQQHQTTQGNTSTKVNHSKNNSILVKKAPSYHKVKSGETLSIIAQKYGLNYEDIAKLNKIPAPYNKIQTGQKLNLKGLKPVSTSGQGLKATWQHPTKSHNRKFLQGEQHTVYYKGKLGDAVYAVADGYVLYADVATKANKSHIKLNEKGHTIIIAHANDYKTAYSHLSRILVPAGTYVKAGQRIAELGQSGQINEPLLGFQIKYQSNFLNPKKIIP